ncbi:12002_t:CDS:2, partial [Cetraspora pellucida]
ANCKHDRQPKWPMLDEVMHVWTESALAANMDLTQAALLTKTKTFAIVLNISDFKGTGYTLENIWNADETSLYWKMCPSKTLAQEPVSGYKKEKVRATVMFA